MNSELVVIPSPSADGGIYFFNTPLILSHQYQIKKLP